MADALTIYTIEIVNNLTDPTILGDGKIDTTVISPTGITTPQTPFVEYVSDMLTVTPGTVSVPLYNREQFFNIPAQKTVTFTTDNGQEALYYAGLTVEGTTITVTTSPVADNG